MMHAERRAVSQILDEFTKDGRQVQLYSIAGQSMFPMLTKGGGLRCETAMYPILRGKGEKAPKFEGAFPGVNGEMVDLGEGWKVLCVLTPFQCSAVQLLKILNAAEKYLKGE